MKKILATLLLFMSIIGYSQTNGITYQAVIMNPSGEQLPGVNNINAPLANKNICLKFSIIDNNSQSEYIETVQTTTDEFGMVNLVIGTGVQIGGYASSFSNILWNANPKSLKVDLSTTGICSYYTEISNQPFTAVPFALYAVNSESAAALAALQATVAANATATSAALALKEDAANKSTTTTLGTSNVLFPTQNAVKTYVDSNITTVNANNTALQATVTANATATTAALALKEDVANKSTTTTLGTSNVLFPTQNAVKTYVDTNITSVNANNTALQATVTANATATTAALALKEDAVNKSTTTTLGTSNVLFPTQNAVKTYVDSQVASATIPDANATTKGKIQLAGDLGGTAAVPTVPGLANKENSANKSTTTTLGNSDVLFPTQNAVKTYVDAQISSATIADADATTKGKIQLAGDLVGTAAAPVVAANAITTSKILDANVTDAKIATVSGSKVTGNITGSAANVTGIVPVANGGTGQTTIAAVKSILGLSGTNVGIGAASGTTNQGAGAVGVGNGTGQTNQGSQSVAIGYVAGNSNQGANSVAIGSNAAQGGQGTQSVAIGIAANSSANNATAVGGFSSAGHTNATAIGYQAVTSGSNTIQLGADGVTIPGSTAITNVKTSGTLTAGAVTYPNTHGSTGQVLSTTGSGTLTWVAPNANSLSGTVAVANGGTGATTATGALTNLGAAPLASPTFTGTVTSPIYASTPQALTDATTIVWNPANGLNASVTLGGNRTLSFTATPAVGSYGTLIVTQDATGGRTINLPSTSNKVLGSTSTTTIALSSAANAKDILNFYYDGTNCYWNIGQGYGSAATAASTNLASGVSGTLPVANGGSGAATLTGYIKGNGTSAMTANASIPVADVTDAAPLASPTFTGTPAAPTATAGTNTTQIATTEFVTGAVALATITDATTTAKGKLQLAGDLAGTADAPTVPGLSLKAPIASPTFTGAVTAPIYASTPQALTDAATIDWNPINGLNASVTLGGNRTLNFTTTPAVGSYGTLVVSQDATGGRTITLPSTSNKVLGSTSTTTITLSSAANAKDILNFYYDGTNCYWNIGQGYGTAATVASTNLASSVLGTLAVANGGTGATTLTGIVKGNGTTALTAAVAGTDYQAPLTLTTTGSGAATLSGTTLNIPATTNYSLPTASTSALGGVKVGTNLSIDGTGVLSTIAAPTFTGAVTAPIFASTPQALTDAATIVWNPASGLNASVTLGGNRILSFSSTPAVGSYGTLVISQDATGGRTITLPSTSNKVLGSTSTTTITLSSAANAKDILNFYYDGANCYWNIGQGYGTAATVASTNLTSSVSGTLPIANGGTGATTKATAFDALSPMTSSGDIIYGGLNGTGTRLSKGSNGSILTMENDLPIWNTSIKATPGSSYNAPVGFSFIGGDWARNTGMFSDNPDAGGSATLKFRIATSNSTANSYLEINPSKVSVLPTTASTSKTTGALTVSGGLGVNGDIYTNNLNASGTVTAGSVTYPNTHNSIAGQVLTTNATGIATWAASSALPSKLEGTGFSGGLLVGHQTTGDITGVGAFQNTGVGVGALVAISNSAIGNTATGYQSLQSVTSAQFNTAMGYRALKNVTTSLDNTAFGSQSLMMNTGTANTAIGNLSLLTNTTGNNNTAIGASADVSSANLTNATAIGFNAKVATSNTIQLGNANVTNVQTSGTVTAGAVTYPNAHGTANQVLSTSGTGTLAWTTPAAVRLNSDEISATAAQTSFTLTQTPLGAKVWMFVNGVRIRNAAYTISGATVTYVPASNSNYALVAGDRIQFDYAY